jgi:hypothetical protein
MKTQQRLKSNGHVSISASFINVTFIFAQYCYGVGSLFTTYTSASCGKVLKLSKKNSRYLISSSVKCCCCCCCCFLFWLHSVQLCLFLCSVCPFAYFSLSKILIIVPRSSLTSCRKFHLRKKYISDIRKCVAPRHLSKWNVIKGMSCEGWDKIIFPSEN